MSANTPKTTIAAATLLSWATATTIIYLILPTLAQALVPRSIDPYGDQSRFLTTEMMIVISCLGGALVALVSYRWIARILVRTGLPGLAPFRDGPDESRIRISLVTMNGPAPTERFSIHLRARHLIESVSSRHRYAVSMVSKQGLKLAIRRKPFDPLQTGTDENSGNLIVQLKKGRRVHLDLELIQTAAPIRRVDSERAYTQVTYRLGFVGCAPGDPVAGWLTFTGESGAIARLSI